MDKNYLELKNKLLKYAYHYYCLNTSLISDEEYDKLFEKVKELEEKLDIKEKITDKLNLGYFEGDKKDLRKIKHPIPMLSIEKKKEDDKKCRKVVMLKIDGVGIEIIYSKGILKYILTRGDGEYGYDITYLQDYLKIPINIDFEVDGDLVIRGELVSLKDLDNKNHRNIVAGYINRNTEIPKDTLHFLAYHLFLIENGKDILDYSYSKRLTFIKQHFETPPYIIVEGIVNYEMWYDELRKNVKYPSDGLVITFDNEVDIENRTSRFFKWNYCWKPDSEIRESVILDVVWQIGKRGILTPVAIIEPVEISGARVERVSLSNLRLIKEKDIAIGDTVLVTRANEIIPYIVEVLDRPEDRIPIDITVCPNCGNPVKKINQGTQVFCYNEECSGLERLYYFCQVLNIKGLGKKRLEKLLDKGLVYIPEDLYNLTEEQIAKAINSEEVAKKIIDNIEKSKKVDIIKLLTALNISNVSESTLKKINSELPIIKDGSLNPKIFNYDIVINIPTIGEVKAYSFIEFMKTFDLEKWKNLGFNNLEVKDKKEKPSVVITGRYKGLTRNEIINRLEKHFDIKKQVSSKVKMLLVGEKPSQQKIEKAQELGISIVPLENFEEILWKDE